MNSEGVLLKAVDLLIQVLRALRGRPSVYVRILDDEIEQEEGGLRFEIENRRWTVTSLDPRIVVKYHTYHANGYRRELNSYYVREVDRRLEPFQPKILTASADKRPREYWLSWYRTYKFRPTSGLTTRVRVRHAGLDPLTLLQFVREYIRFRYLGKAVAGGPETLDDYKRMKRSRGPH